MIKLLTKARSAYQEKELINFIGLHYRTLLNILVENLKTSGITEVWGVSGY